MTQEVPPAEVGTEEADSQKKAAPLSQEDGHPSDGQGPETTQPQVGERAPQEEVANNDPFDKRCRTPCACYKMRVLAMDRAANATRQVEGLRVQLAQSHAHAKQLDDAWKRRLKDVEDDHARRIAELSAEADRLRAQLADCERQLETSKLQSKELTQKNRDLELKLASGLSSKNEVLQGSLDSSRKSNTHLKTLLKEERHRKEQLAGRVGLYQEQLQILESLHEKCLFELKRKDEILEMFEVEALERIAIAVGPPGRADLLRLIAVLKGTPLLGEDINQHANGTDTGKCDSGYQGSAAAGSAEHSKVAQAMTPVDDKSVDIEKINEAERELRRYEEKLEMLERAKQHTQRRISLLENSLEFDSKRRTSSKGFEPGFVMTPPTPAQRKVWRRDKPLSSTPQAALETLSDVSSIRHDAADSTPRFKGPSSETKDASGSVFLRDSEEKRGRRSSRTDFSVHRASGSGSGTPNVGSDSNGKVSTTQWNRTLQHTLQQSKSVQTDQVSALGPKPGTSSAATTVADGCGSRARRRLEYDQSDGIEPTMPFSFSSSSSRHLLNRVPSPTPGTAVVVNINMSPQTRSSDVTT